MIEKLTKKQLDDLTYSVVGAAIEVFEAQLLTYMKLLRAPKGILINFNCLNIFNEGQKTYVNEYFKN